MAWRQKREGSTARRNCHICKAGHRIEDCLWFGIWPQAGTDEGLQSRRWVGTLTAERIIERIGIITSYADDGTPTRTLCPRQALVGDALRAAFNNRVPTTIEFCCRRKFCHFYPRPDGVSAAFAAWLPGNFLEAVNALSSANTQLHTGASKAAALAMNYTAPGAGPVLQQHQPAPTPPGQYAQPTYGYGHYAQPLPLAYPPPPLAYPPPPLAYPPPPPYPQQQPQYAQPVGGQQAQPQRAPHIAMPPAVRPDQPNVFVQPQLRPTRYVIVTQPYGASAPSSSSQPPADDDALRRRARQHGASSSQARAQSPPPKRVRKQQSEPMTFNKDLPVSFHEEEITKKLRKGHGFFVVTAETGSGKTTQVPKMAFNASGRCVALTQPRRIAVRETAARITAETNGAIGSWMRGEKSEDADDADIVVLTDGIMRRLAADPDRLRAYSTIIVDEAHERSENLDMLLMWLKDGIDKLPKLNVIIMSATVDAQVFVDHFKALPFNLPGRTNPIEIVHEWQTPDAHPLGQYANRQLLKTIAASPKTATEMAFYAHAKLDLTKYESEIGDAILVFVDGEAEVRRTVKGIEESCKRSRAVEPTLRGVQVMPLMRKMPKDQQQAAIHCTATNGRRKIIVATNIAETSLTIDGIVAVVDSGNVKRPYFDTKTTLVELHTEHVSKAEAKQRAGRAGRQQAGTVYRCYGEDSLTNDSPPPEINRCDARSIVMELIAAKADIKSAPFLVQPDDARVEDAKFALRFCGALTATDTQTDIGKAVTALPLETNCALLVAIAVESDGCILPAVCLAALISSEESIFKTDENGKQKNRIDALGLVRGKHNCRTSMLALLAVYAKYFNTKSDTARTELMHAHNLSRTALYSARDTADEVLDRVHKLYKASPDSRRIDPDWRTLRHNICRAFAMTAARPSKSQPAAPRNEKRQVKYTLARNGLRVALDPDTDGDLSTDDEAFVVAAGLSGNRLQSVCAVEPEWLKEMVDASGLDMDDVFKWWSS